jgi:hypothetical protein
MLGLALAPAGSLAAPKPVPVARGVDSVYPLRADVRPGQPPVLRRLQIAGTGAGVIKWRCSGSCHRASGPASRISHPNGTTVVGHLNLKLRGTSRLKIDVIVPSGQSRYLVLTTSGKRLRVTSTGCIDGRGRAGACTRGEPQAAAPSLDTPAAPPAPQAAAPNATPSPTPTPAPTPAPPANNPEGRLIDVSRADIAHAEVFGWARDADAPDAPVTVRALVAGVPAAEASAATFSPTFGGRMFDFLVPVDTDRHTICVVALNIGGGADTVLSGCRDVFTVGDLNEDGYVGCYDLALLVSEFNQTGANLPGDIDNNGTVTAHDMSLLLGKWSPPPSDPNPCPTTG